MTRDILVVIEDDAQMQLLISMNLEVDPRLHLVGAAANARDAIELARTSEPGLIIVDHYIDGDIMGLEAAPLLKQAAPQAKILLFTSHDLRIEADREPSIDAFLSKTRISQLLPTVLDLLGLEPATPLTI